MSLPKLKRQFEERRLALIETLQKGRDTLDLSKQHQLYGAIKEIENFLKTIDYYHEEQLNGEAWELKSIEPKMKKAAGHARERTKRFFTGVGHVLREKVAHPARRAAHAVKRKVRLVKDVTREVKARSSDEKSD
jgi:hypothetical protein